MSSGSPNASSFTFVLNGKPVSVAGIPPQTTLLDFIRDRGLTGVKEGCAEGECGACNVVCVVPYAVPEIAAHHSNGTAPKVSAFRAVNSCLMMLPMAAGKEIYTVEALARNGELAAVQQALANAGGSQCGYCTPGFVMSLFAEHYRPNRRSPCDPHAMGGNLCRCTGYRPIRDAALALAEPPQDLFSERLTHPAPSVEGLSYEANDAVFVRPGTLGECLAEIEDADTKLIAGATDLGVESNLRFRRWKRLLSLESIAELREFRETSASVYIGAGLPLTDIAARWANAPPVFHEWISLFASPTLRNRATLGGNLATASPIGDSAPLLLALGAVVHLARSNGRRMVPLDRFFTGYRKTLLEPGELIVAIEIPKPLPQLLSFYKIVKRQMDDISTVAAAFAIDLDSARQVRVARFAFGGVAATPMRATAAAETISGRVWDLDAVGRGQRELGRLLAPLSDHRGSADYRREVSKALLDKFAFENQGALS